MKNNIAFCLGIVSLCSCSQFNNDLDERLLGSWQLQASTTVSGEYRAADNSKEITFIENGFFIMEVYGGYMDGEFGGKYFILDNDKRNGRTLTLVPNTYTQRSDTVSLECKNYDVVSIDDSILILRGHTEFIDAGGSKAAVFNRRDRYRRSD